MSFKRSRSSPEPAEIQLPMVGTSTIEVLPSGLSLVTELWGNAPVVAIQVWVSAGSSSDPETGSGAAHFLEHMVFKGAGTLAGLQLTDSVEAVGGDLNAWTSIDQTCFHVTTPLSGFEVAARALGALAGLPWLLPTDLAPERGVVIEEIRGAQDDPGSLLADAIRKAIWREHPGGRPVLGSEASVGRLSIEDLKAFYLRQYHPRQMALVVAGAVDPDRVRAVAMELDAALTERASLDPLMVPPVEPAASNGPRVVLVQAGHEDRIVEIAFPTPGPAHPDQAALDVLTVCLGDGGGARLVRALRDEHEVAVHAWAALETEQAGGMAAVGAMPREGRECASVRELGREVVRIQQVGPSQQELVRARGLVRADALAERETVDGRAHRLGWYWHRFGNLEAEARYMAAVARVSSEDVRRVARKWLDGARAVIGVATGDDALSEAQVLAAWRAGTRPRSIPRAVRGPSLVTRVLPGGLQVSVESRPRAELVGVSVIGLGGNIAEPERRAGVASMWSRLLTRGAGALPTRALAELVEARSGSLNAWTARNSIGLDVVWPGDGMAWLGWLLHETLCAPRFDPEEFDRALDDLRIELDLSADDPATLARDGVFADLYPHHAWARPTEGNAGGLGRIDLDAVRRYHRRVTNTGNLKVAVSGPVSPDEVFAVLAPLARALPEGRAHPLRPPSALGRSQGRSRRRLVPRGDAQAHVCFGLPGQGLGIHGADEGAARILEAVLCGTQGGGGRLFQRVREELGLAYSVGASWEGGLGAGAMLVSAATDPANVASLVDAMWECCRGVGDQGIRPDEWERVQSGLADGVHIGLQRSLSRARHIAAAATYRRDPALWTTALSLPETVERDAVEALARTLFQLDRRHLVCAGPRRRSW